MLYQFVRLLCSAINKRNIDIQHASRELILSENILSKQLFTIDFYILNRSITLHYYNIALQKIPVKIATYSTAKIIFTEKEFQPTYVHI